MSPRVRVRALPMSASPTTISWAEPAEVVATGTVVERAGPRVAGGRAVVDEPTVTVELVSRALAAVVDVVDRVDDVVELAFVLDHLHPPAVRTTAVPARSIAAHTSSVHAGSTCDLNGRLGDSSRSRAGEDGHLLSG